MKSIATLLLSAVCSISALAQTDTITNASFERWGNPSPGLSNEPASWYSNKSGGGFASSGSTTCFQDDTAYAGSYSVKVETVSDNLGVTTVIVNGNVTTGVVNAPGLTKTSGYIGTVNYTTASDVRHMIFTGRPDSLVGWYQYTPGDPTERGKIRAILHTGDYYDPELPTTYHPDPTPNKIADALFLTDTPGTSVTAWTRFSVPFTYVSASNPAYIMINATSSNNQNTSVAGSVLLLDNLKAIYNGTSNVGNVKETPNVHVYAAERLLHADLRTNEPQSILSVFDVAGRKVFSQPLQSLVNTYDLSYLATGVYIYQVSNVNFCEKGKIIVQ